MNKTIDFPITSDFLKHLKENNADIALTEGKYRTMAANSFKANHSDFPLIGMDGKKYLLGSHTDIHQLKLFPIANGTFSKYTFLSCGWKEFQDAIDLGKIIFFV